VKNLTNPSAGQARCLVIEWTAQLWPAGQDRVLWPLAAM